MRPLAMLLPVFALGLSANALAQDHFSGRYRSVSGADHDVIVVAPAEPGHWSVALERPGTAPTLHPDGPMVEAAARMTQWFAESLPPDSMRCLVASRAAAFPLLCSLPQGAAPRFRDGVPTLPAASPLLGTGWLLLVRTRYGIDVTELVRD